MKLQFLFKNRVADLKDLLCLTGKHTEPCQLYMVAVACCRGTPMGVGATSPHCWRCNSSTHRKLEDHGGDFLPVHHTSFIIHAALILSSQKTETPMKVVNQFLTLREHSSLSFHLSKREEGAER